MRRSLRYYWLKFLRMQDTPHRIALGIAIGMFINFTPFVGFHTILAVLSFFLLPVNRIATLSAVWLNTPWTVPVLLALDYKLGSWLMACPATWTNFNFTSFQSLLEFGCATFMPMLYGGIILGLLGAVLSYALSLNIMLYWRRQRKAHLLKVYNSTTLP